MTKIIVTICTELFEIFALKMVSRPVTTPSQLAFGNFEYNQLKTSWVEFPIAKRRITDKLRSAPQTNLRLIPTCWQFVWDYK